MSFYVPSSRLIAIATFLLNDADISAKSQSFLIKMRDRARSGGARIHMSEGQFDWWMDLQASHAREITEAERFGLMSPGGVVWPTN